MPLKDICEFIIDCEHKTAPVQSTGYPSIRTPNIGRGWLELDDVNHVSQATYEEWTQRAKPKEGDLILAREAPIGNVAIIPNNLEVCLGQRTVLIRPNREKVNPHFLLYLLLGNEIQNKLQAFSGGVTVAHLNMGEIRKLELPNIPGRIIQDKIASILSAYDDLIQNNLRRIKILEEVAQTLYREWFVKFRFPGHQKVRMVNSSLGKIPEGWEAINILALIEERKARNTNDETLPVLSVTNNRAFVFSDDYFSKRVYSRSLKNYKLVEKDDFAFNPARVNIGSIAMLDNQQRGLVSPMYSVFRAHSKVLPSVLWAIINEERTMEQIRKLCFGTVRQIFKLNDFQQVMIVLPSITVQRSWLSIIAPFEQQAKLLRKKNDILRQTRDLLLPKLTSGELDVSELDITIPEANA